MCKYMVKPYKSFFVVLRVLDSNVINHANNTNSFTIQDRNCIHNASDYKIK